MVQLAAASVPLTSRRCVTSQTVAGYYGRPFEARNKPKGSSFTGDNKVGWRCAALHCAVLSCTVLRALQPMVIAALCVLLLAGQQYIRTAGQQ